MHNPEIVAMSEGFKQLPHARTGVALAKATALDYLIEEFTACYLLHDQVRFSGRIDNLNEVHNVRVAGSRKCRNFHAQCLHAPLISKERRDVEHLCRIIDIAGRVRC